VYLSAATNPGKPTINLSIIVFANAQMRGNSKNVTDLLPLSPLKSRILPNPNQRYGFE